MRLFEGTQFDIPPTCERCEKAEADCQCPPLKPVEERVPANQQQLKVFEEKRKHKRTFTLVRGLHKRDRKEVLTKLKDALGSGGTIKDETIELQGAHAEKAKQALRGLGFKVLGS